MTVQEKSCGAIVIRNFNDKFQVLVIRQRQGHWCFPKGHVEKDETEHETAIREIKEETGYDVKIMDGFRHSTQYSPKENVMKEVVYFLAEVVGGEPKVQIEEVSELHWVSVIEADSLITYDNDAEIFNKAMRAVKKMDPDGEIWNL